MSPMQKTARNALRNAQAGQELAQASAAVITRRFEIMGEALADPLRADHAELSRMGVEKVEAMTASAGAAYTGALDLAERAGRLAAREGAEAADCLAKLARADTPFAFAAARPSVYRASTSRPLIPDFRARELSAKSLTPSSLPAIAGPVSFATRRFTSPYSGSSSSLPSRLSS